jgi:hypothetical protein
MDYKDFALQLDCAAGQPGFVTRVLHSPAGEAEAPFVNPISWAELDDLWQTALRARLAARGSRDVSARLLSPVTESVLEEIGDRLFRALFRGAVRSCWVRSFSEATRHPEGGLRLKLQLNLGDPQIASLADLPWELLFSPEHGGFLALQRRTPILRHMRLPLPGSRPLPARPIRLLTVLSQPKSMTQLSLEAEGKKIASTLGALPGVEVVPLHNPTIEALRERLLESEFHILHFMGHGGFEEHSGQGALYFTDASGAPVPVSGSLLASHLAGMDSLRLVFINACETARSSAVAPFAGVATALLRAGLPAVIAMQRPIGDEAALELSRTVYRRLAAGDPIDAAMTEGRLAIARDRGSLLEWGTPVLFSRAEDGRIFAAEPTETHPVPAAAVLSGAATGSPSSPPGSRQLVLLGLLVATGLGIAAARWPFEGGPAVGPAREPVPAVTPFETPTPTPPPAETPAPPKPHTIKPKADAQPESHSVVPPARSNSSYVLSEGNPVFIPGLEAEVGARFFERDGYSFARFSIAPQDAGMLEHPPVMSTGTLDFPSQNGTYHLDVLSLDKAAKRATVRLRLESP